MENTLSCYLLNFLDVKGNIQKVYHQIVLFDVKLVMYIDVIKNMFGRKCADICLTKYLGRLEF